MRLELSESFKGFLEDFFVSSMRLERKEGERFKKEMQYNHEKYLVALLLAIKKKAGGLSSFTVDSIAFEATGEKYLEEAQRLLKEKDHPHEIPKRKEIRASQR